MITDAPSITKEQLTLQKVALHPTAASHRFHLLDALRGVAALLIVCYHVTEYLPHGGFPNTYLAVDFFFCLSGFVIAFSYEKRLAEALSLKNFFVARLIRLYPIYLLGCVFGIAILVMNHPYNFEGKDGFRLTAMVGLQLAMLPNPRILGNYILFPLNIAAWSLFYELVANFAFASLVRMKLASGWVLAILALLSLILLTVSTLHGGSFDVGGNNTWYHIHFGIARVTLSFSIGVLVFRLSRRTHPYRLTHTQQWILASAIPLALTFILMSSFTDRTSIVFPLLTVTVLFPALVYLGALSTTPTSWKAACVFLGDISYPVYLLQGFFLAVLYKPHVLKVARQYPTLTVACIVLLLTAIAHLAVKFYDAPLRKRLTRYYNSIGLATTTATFRAWKLKCTRRFNRISAERQE